MPARPIRLQLGQEQAPKRGWSQSNPRVRKKGAAVGSRATLSENVAAHRPAGNLGGRACVPVHVMSSAAIDGDSARCPLPPSSHHARRRAPHRHELRRDEPTPFLSSASRARRWGGRRERRVDCAHSSALSRAARLAHKASRGRAQVDCSWSCERSWSARWHNADADWPKGDKLINKARKGGRASQSLRRRGRALAHAGWAWRIQPKKASRRACFPPRAVTTHQRVSSPGVRPHTFAPIPSPSPPPSLSCSFYDTPRPGSVLLDYPAFAHPSSARSSVAPHSLPIHSPPTDIASAMARASALPS